ncbi:hypothetical protein D9613_002583 [Agrocybe pediades]|uniref:PWWP domain-containing protein n=1 Tax=Agrocybe pediades TaxID=84607 RepID=A0A8H4VP33_9AGAR|nr:hypothetical protein D9613_002583 [Agrocybe pediades]
MSSSSRRRQSAVEASDAIANQLDSDSDSELSTDSLDAVPPARTTYSSKKKYAKKTSPAVVANGSKSSGEDAIHASQPSTSSVRLGEPSFLATSPSKEPTPPRDIGGPFTQMSDLFDLSDLTSLSSDESTSHTTTKKKNTTSSKPRRVETASASTTKPRKVKQTLGWKAPDVGSYVWVLIEPKTQKAYDQAVDEKDEVEHVWWPAKVTAFEGSSRSLKVLLFGAKRNVIDVAHPSRENVTPQKTPLSRLRFRTLTCTPPRKATDDELPMTSRKKQKLSHGDLREQWDSAVNAMKIDASAKPFPLSNPSAYDSIMESDDSDDLPEYYHISKHPSFTSVHFPLPNITSARTKMDTSVAQIQSVRKNKSKRKRNEDSFTDSDEDIMQSSQKNNSWKPPGPDMMFEIPGELVFARISQNATFYWPARIESYQPPANKRQQGKYSVTWVDGKQQHNILRSWIASSGDPEFTTCKVGQFSSTVVEVQNDDENDDEHDRYQESSADRSPSPEMLDPPPSGGEFCLLDIRQQFAYVKPVLHAIIEDKYLPVRERHEKYMKGGRHRKAIQETAPLRGRVDPKDVESLLRMIQKTFAGSKTPPSTFTNGKDGPPNASENSSIVKGSSFSSDMPNQDNVQSTSPPLSPNLLSSPAPEPPSSSVPPPPTQPTADDAAGETPVMPLEAEQSSSRVSFHSLSPIMKINYCSDILLPEAIRQILLWRFEERKTAALLSSDEEQELFEKGEALLQERDWVRDLMRLRGLQSSLTKNRNTPKSPKGKSLSGRSTRNRSFVNYQE